MGADGEKPPEAEDIAWSMAASAPSQALAPSSRRWARVVAALGVLAAVGLAVGGLFWTRSLDLPWGGDHRYGLFGQGLPSVWICSEGHHHYSIPFWMGGLLALLATALFFRVFGRPRARRGRLNESTSTRAVGPE